jgi:hypothetical protein
VRTRIPETPLRAGRSLRTQWDVLRPGPALVISPDDGSRPEHRTPHGLSVLTYHAQSRSRDAPRFRCQLMNFGASSAVRFRSSPAYPRDVIKCHAFKPERSPPRLLPEAASGSLEHPPTLQGDSEGSAFIFRTARRPSRLHDTTPPVRPALRLRGMGLLQEHGLRYEAGLAQHRQNGTEIGCLRRNTSISSDQRTAAAVKLRTFNDLHGCL